MKKSILFFTLLAFCNSFSQESQGSTTPKPQHSFSAEYYYGNIIQHQPSVGHLISGHPEGFILSYNQKRFGKEAWEQTYNFPDIGFSFSYQDYKNEVVGKLYALYAHYNFYFFNRLNKNQLVLRAGIGVAYNTNPYDKETNNKNISFGTYLNSSTYFKLYYQRERLFKNVGVTAGLTFIHASNSNVKSPNTGLNTWGTTVGLNYNIDDEDEVFTTHEIADTYKEPIKFNFIFRTGMNESEIIGSGLKPFFVFSGYADKRLSRKSAIQVGTDVFISPFLKDYIEYYHINFPGDSDANTSDITRVSLFLGHELFVNKFSVIAQLGYYLYYPFEYEARYYERLGLKRYFGDKWFAVVSLKAHGANAETVEFGVGIRI
ncbi:MAG: acyloxyacyl hydrolase [Urechidicola sp.]|nr:acyloxyacyl hydrolase [Urechidicola sp.]